VKPTGNQNVAEFTGGSLSGKKDPFDHLVILLWVEPEEERGRHQNRKRKKSKFDGQ